LKIIIGQIGPYPKFGVLNYPTLY